MPLPSPHVTFANEDQDGDGTACTDCNDESSSSSSSRSVSLEKLAQQQQQSEGYDDENVCPLTQSARSNRQLISQEDEVFWIVEEFSTCEEVRQAIQEEEEAKEEASPAEEEKAASHAIGHEHQSNLQSKLAVDEVGNDQQDHCVGKKLQQVHSISAQESTSMTKKNMATGTTPIKVSNNTTDGEESCAGTVQISISSWDDSEDIVPVRYVYVNNQGQEEDDLAEDDDDEISLCSARATFGAKKYLQSKQQQQQQQQQQRQSQNHKPNEQKETEVEGEGWNGFKLDDFVGAYRQSTFAKNMDFIATRGSIFSQNIDYLRRQTETFTKNAVADVVGNIHNNNNDDDDSK